MNQGSVEQIYDLTPLQQGILFHSVSSPASTVYNIQLVFAISGPLEPETLARCWERVAARHAPLRTCFAWERIDQPYQVVHRDIPAWITHFDWRDVPEDERNERLARRVREDRDAPFDLRQAPLMRLAIVAFSAHEYRMVWTFHHVILEGWSAAIALNEVWTLYREPAESRATRLAPVRPYVDYVRWLQGQDRGCAESYWRASLQGYRQAPRLPIDGASERGNGAPAELREHRVVVSAETCAALCSVSRTHRLTVNTVVQGLWSILLGRYCGETDIVFGTALSGRPPALPGVESMVGLFVNVLPVRVRPAPAEPLLEWLQALQRDLAALREYEYCSLMQVKSWSEIPAGEPLFETAVAFENWQGDIPAEAAYGALTVRTLELHNQSDQPLSLFVTLDKTLSLTIMYDARRFDAAATERMLDHFAGLVQSFVADPGQRTCELQMLSPPERTLVLEQWSRSQSFAPEGRRVHELVEAQALRTPDAVAIASEGRRLSYAELDERANRLAHYLCARDVGRESIVVVALDRSPEMIVVLLGILKAGAAYAPLDPALPAERVRYVLGDTHAPVAFCRAALAGELAPYGGEVIDVETLGARLAGERASAPAAACGPGDRAYVIYTSGSTGVPKGVEIAHGGLSNLVAWHHRAYHLGAHDRTSHLAGLGFDGSVWELWPSLCAGASVHLVPEDLRRAPRELWRWLARQQITMCFMPTPLAEAALAEPVPEDIALRVLLTGGDRLHGGLVDRPLPFALVNHYGPTENSVVATCGEVDPRAPRPPSIGRPIANVRAYILDPWLNPVPPGFPGELCLGGRGVALGYLNQPGLTAAKFVPDPFGGETGGRLYRTGDLAAFGTDGNIEFLGRTDDQIKVRGFRIEPEEIETALAAHPEVSCAVVVARASGGDGPRLVAYVVPKAADQPIEGHALRAYLAGRLPEFMLPASYVAVRELPLTDNGKIDRDALPAPSRTIETAAPAAGEPPSDLERIMIGLWESTLEIEGVQPQDMFLDLGGHSLLAIKVIDAFRHETGISIKPTDLVRYSVRQLLCDIDDERVARPATPGPVTGFLRGIRNVFGRNPEQVND